VVRDGLKACRFCGERIPPHSIRCPFCHGYFASANEVSSGLRAGVSPEAASGGEGAGRMDDTLATAQERHRRRVRRRWLLVAVAVAASAGVALVLALRPSESSLSADPPAVRLEAGDGVAEADRARIVELAGAAEGVLAEAAGGHLPSLVVYADGDLDALARRLAEKVGVPQAEARYYLEKGWVEVKGMLFLSLSALPLGDPEDFFYIAHEVAHLFESALAAPGRSHLARACDDPAVGSWRMPYTGPMWLAEGIADWLAFEAWVGGPYFPPEEDPVAEEGAFLTDAYRNLQRPLKSLTEWGVWGRGSEPYVIAALAAKSLEARAGESALYSYWDNMGDGLCWDTAFLNAFGLAPDDFYTLFEQERAAAATAGTAGS
jgi:hypothetical protein